MGGCASKPKGLKAEIEGVSAPEPVPEVVKEETSTLTNEKEIQEVKKPQVDEDDDEQLPKVEDDGEVDEKGIRRRSLNSLLNEIEEAKDSVECEKPTQTVTVPAEPIKKVEEPKVEIVARESSSTDVTKSTPDVAPVVTPVVTPVDKVETEKKPVESAPAVVAPLEKVEAEKKPVESAPAVVAPLEKVETAQKVESAPIVETVKPEEKVDVKKDAEVKPTVEKASEVVIKNEQPALPVSSSIADVVKGVVSAETK